MSSRYPVLVIGLILTVSSLAFVSAPVNSLIDNAEPGTRSIEFDRYHDYDETVEFLNEQASQYPEITKLRILGKTWEQRDILALKISDNPDSDETSEPDVLYMGAHHGNELISVEVPLYLIDFLLSNYGRNSTVTNWVDTREIWFLPMVNPDGVQFTIDGISSRKNRRPIDSDGDGSVDAYGVDLNRNYAHRWGEQEASTLPSNNVYQGAYPFSENETIAVRNLALTEGFELSMSFHSYGQQVFFPWGNSIDTAHPEYDTLEAIAGEIAERNGYTAVEGKVPFQTSGDSDDWLYANTSTLPFTVELGTEYAPPADEIQAIVENNLLSSLYLLEIADDPSIAQEPDWTFMVYMAADNSLTAAALDDLKEMAEVGSTPDVQIIVLYDGDLNGDSKLFRIEKDMTFDVSQYSGSGPEGNLDDAGFVIDGDHEVDMDSPDTLDNFVTWAEVNFPSQKSALVIWDHGNGLFGGLNEDGFRRMETWELGGALDGHSFDVIGMDLCWLGQVEVAYELLGKTDYFIASDALEPEDGWDYSASLRFLTDNPNSQPREFSKRIVDDYLRSYPWIGYITMAAVDMQVFETPFIPALNDLANTLFDFSYYNYSQIKAARNATAILDAAQSHVADLSEFLDELRLTDISRPVIEKADALSDVLDDMLIASGQGASFPQAAGLGIYFPQLAYNNIYDSNFAFADEDWNEFLHELENPSQKPIIRHTPLSDANNTSGPYVIKARVIDNDINEDSVKLHYRVANGNWQNLPMRNESDRFVAEIGGLANGTQVDYYITATDRSNNSVRFPYEVTKGVAEFLNFQILAEADLFVDSITISPESNITAGDNVTFTLQVGNNGPETPVPATLNVYLNYSADDDVLIHSTPVYAVAGQPVNVTFNWTAAEGDHTLFFEILADGAINKHTGDQYYDLAVASPSTGAGPPEETNGTLTGGGVPENLWGLPVLILLVSSLLSMSLLMLAKVQITRKRRENALRSLRRTTVLIREIGDYGIDNTEAFRILENARRQIKLKNYNRALMYSIQAREHADWSLKKGLDYDTEWSLRL